MSDFLKSFVYAFQGLIEALRTERNFRILWLCALLVFLANFLIIFEFLTQIIFLVLVFIILALELINSALEKYGDNFTREHSELIKKAKDFGAAAVMLCALGAFLIFGLLLNANWALILQNLKNHGLFFIGLVLIAFLNFPLCLEQKLNSRLLVMSLAGLIIHIGLLAGYSGSLFFLLLSLIFHLSLAGAYLRRQNIC